MIRDNILYGLPLTVPTPTESTGRLLYRHLIKYAGDDKAFVDEVTGKYLTYTQFLRLSCGLAEALMKEGITNDDEIATICSENNIYYFVIVLASVFAGLPITPLNPIYTETELTHALNLTHPTRVFCSKANYGKILELQAEHHWIRRIIVIDGDRTLPKGASLMDFLTEAGTINIDINKFTPKDLDSSSTIALIMFSSGTTGLPKGVAITHRNLNFRLTTLSNPQIWYRTECRNALGVLPFFHAFGLQLGLESIFNGKTIYVLQKFDPIIYLKCIEKYRIDSVIVPPALLVFLAKHPAVDRFDLSFLKDIAYGSAPASPATVKAITRRLGVNPRQAYGLTEATFSISAEPPGTNNSDTIGFVHPGIEVYIRDPDTGKKLDFYQPGEICLRGETVMKGYYANEKATREAFTEDGFLRTGDTGYYNKEERLYIVDRMKELIKYKSFQVAPAELEAVLITHPKIKQAAVIGLPDEEAGELPLAFIVKEDNADLSKDEVKDYLAKFLSRNKHLRGGVIFLDEIPLNSLGKILRRELRKMLPELRSKL